MTNLKRIIDEKGVQQRWLAEQVGVTEVSMSRYVNGERIPKAPMAIRMADVLGVDVKDLYGWDDAHVIGENEAQPETHEERTETHACDLISRQAAIDAILAVTGNTSVRELYEHVQEHGLSDMWSGGVNAAIDIIIAVPSVQTESKETSSTHKALDTISRQAAIDAMCELMHHWFGGDPKDEIREIKRELENRPSAQPDVLACGEGELIAQPEIIRCKECKHSRFFDPCFYCYEFGGEIIVSENGYCYKAERRNDG